MGMLAPSLAAQTAKPPVIQVEIVARYPHDRGAFTQGLLIDDGRLYEGTGQYGESTLREVDLETGRVLRMRRLPPSAFGEGIVVWNDRIIQLTWREGVAIVYDKETFKPIGVFRYDGEGWGITTDGTHLILSDGTARLRFLEPETFRVVRTVEVRSGGRSLPDLNELEYVDGLILANVWMTDWIVLIDPRSGNVVGQLDISRLYPARERPSREAVANGIAYDAKTHRLFVTGKNWPTLFEIRPRVAPGGWFDKNRATATP